MDNILWEKIAAFDLDQPMSEYGFSTRLANENFWTNNFTQKAIAEYKKFMYLAGTSELMVSPSEIIDIVWHQHLIFTQSYSVFCSLIGRYIPHIPSTHNKDDFEKFRQAKERTKTFYNNTFGEQPPDIWEYAGMYEALHLEKAKFKIRTFIIFAILTFIVLIVPSYFLLKPLYIHIDNPYFILSYISIIILILTGLEIYNKSYLNTVVKGFKGAAFIHHLQPLELVYLKTQKLSAVIHGNVSRLVEYHKIAVNTGNTLQLNDSGNTAGAEEFTIMETLKYLGTVPYPVLLGRLMRKPVFSKIAGAMDAFKKYFIKSKIFGKLFYVNFAVFLSVIMFGLIRLITGILRDKPVAQLFIVLIFLIAVVSTFLWRLINLVCTDTIPQFYKNNILPAGQHAETWDWQYFLMGNAVLSPAFIPVVNYTNSSNSSTDSSSSSCSSGCGSSCGSSCGGCGGD